MAYKIYTEDYYGGVEVDYGRGYFRVDNRKITPKMREYLRDVIRNNHWSIDWYVSSVGNPYEYPEPVYHTNYESTRFSWRTMDARHQLSWILLNEQYIGSPLEQGLDALISWWKALRNVFPIKDSFQWNFEGGLFSKPYWVKSRNRRNSFDDIPF